MPRVAFTQNLKRHLACDVKTVGGSTVAEALDEVFRDNQSLRGYILEDNGSVRKHIAVYINSETITDRQHLSDPVCETDEVYVMQALSGG